MLSDISKILERRRGELVGLLENHSDSIELEKQHQIYGAINEIDVVLQTLQYYKAKELNSASDEIKLMGPADQKTVFDKIFDNINRVLRNK
jgi:hypothetical protein